MEKDGILLVNFGGPRNLEEIFPFLKSLLLDKDVIWTPLPDFLHRLLFTRVAKKRAKKIAHDYTLIGGKSPIYEDTQAIASFLEKKLQIPVVCFHRYLPMTHEETLKQIATLEVAKWIVVPLFPQFTYATTGSIARFFSKHLSPKINSKLHWIKSYPSHPLYIQAMKSKIDAFLKEKSLSEEEIVLLFSAHGLPKKFVLSGDPYEQECNATFEALSSFYPKALCKLSYQSKFGKGEWLRPYTDEVCENIKEWNQDQKTVCIVPLSFTSDHIETLFEIEEIYVQKILKSKIHAYRVPALGLTPLWLDNLAAITCEKKDLMETKNLIR